MSVFSSIVDYYGNEQGILMCSVNFSEWNTKTKSLALFLYNIYMV